MKSLIWMLLFSTLAANADVHEFDLSVGEVAVYNSIGTTELVGIPGNKVKFEFEKIRWNKSCDLSVIKELDQLVVRSVQPGTGFWFRGCKANLKIGVPTGIKSRIFSDSGNVIVKNLKGELDFEMGSGDLSVENSILPFVNGMSGSGNLSLDGRFFDINLQSGSGNVVAELHSISGKEKLDVSTGSGNVSVLLPEGTGVQAHFLTGSGEMNSTVSERSGTGVQIKVKTGSGNLKLDYI